VLYVGFCHYPETMRLIGLTGNIAGGKSAVADMLSERGAVIVLNALNDRELADIGLSRLNVRDVAREAVYAN
jgi:uncharacterized protein YjiS (DUF1127 family)